MRKLLTLSCAVLSMAAGVEAAGAATYYYVSGPAIVSNTPAASDRQLLNIGRLDVDASGLPAGETLAGRTIAYSYWDNVYTGHDGIALGYVFALGTGSEGVSYSLTFDAQENISAWRFSSDWNIGGSTMDLFSISNSGDNYRAVQTDGLPFATQRARDELAARGYREGTAIYNALYCGSWAGSAGGCGEDGLASDSWGASFIAGDGVWVRDDLAGFAAQIEWVARAALADPARSYYDIEAVPVPLPLAMIIAGVAGLVLVRRGARVA